MKNIFIKSGFILVLALIISACSSRNNNNNEECHSINSPKMLFGQLFYDILENDSLFGTNRLFADSKDFMDCTPKRDMDSILQSYAQLKGMHNTKEIENFIKDNFYLPNVKDTAEFTDNSHIDIHIAKLWKHLRRNANSAKNTGTLIPLKYDYIVPGGRFREIYYWDSYFTMLGLFADNETELAKNMIMNFSDIINRIGFIPNGNRSYYISRSQPPFFSHMVEALAKNTSEQAFTDYLDAMQKEYDFWMKGSDKLSEEHNAELHCVRMPDETILNRYYDKYDTPREEMYRNDIETAEQLKEAKPDFNEKRLFRDLRSGAESGWDFSSRWLKEYDNLYSIHTTDIIPVDLNSLLYHLEMTLSKAYSLKGQEKISSTYKDKAETRKNSIIKYMWSDKNKFFMDYDFVAGKQTDNFSLAGVYPLFVGISDDEQAGHVAGKIKKDFLKAGGVVTTLYHTNQQWDFPNGWAPLQWITYSAMRNYNQTDIALEIKDRWTGMVNKVYNNTGKLLEKYDVVNVSDTGGGEYPNQDGFGWTNGVYRAFCTTD